MKAWPTLAENDAEIGKLFEIPELRQKAILESTTKYVDHEALRKQLDQLKRDWPKIRERLSQRMMSVDELRGMLEAAGCPVRSEDIGISPERLRISFRKAYHIRRRFTIFDLVRRANIWDALPRSRR